MRIFAENPDEKELDELNHIIEEVISNANVYGFRDIKLLIREISENAPDIIFLNCGKAEFEAAKVINEMSFKTKLVFIARTDEFSGKAFEALASGYFVKPIDQAKLKTLIQKLQQPLCNDKIFIKTFGNFEIYHNGNPVAFRSRKAKELLAYLVDREGARISRQEAAGILYGDNFSPAAQVGLTKIANKLTEDLEKEGIDGFFVKNNGYFVNLSMAECDFIEHIKGNPEYPFLGEYLEQYSWGEFRKASFAELKK